MKLNCDELFSKQFWKSMVPLSSVNVFFANKCTYNPKFNKRQSSTQKNPWNKKWNLMLIGVGKKWEENKEGTQPLCSLKVPHFQKQMLNQHATKRGVKPHFRPRCAFFGLYKLWENSAIALYLTTCPGAIHCLLLFNAQVLTLSALIDAKASSFSLMASSWESLATDSLASISLDRPIK